MYMIFDLKLTSLTNVVRIYELFLFSYDVSATHVTVLRLLQVPSPGKQEELRMLLLIPSS